MLRKVWRSASGWMVSCFLCNKVGAIECILKRNKWHYSRDGAYEKFFEMRR